MTENVYQINEFKQVILIEMFTFVQIKMTVLGWHELKMLAIFNLKKLTGSLTLLSKLQWFWLNIYILTA